MKSITRKIATYLTVRKIFVITLTLVLIGVYSHNAGATSLTTRPVHDTCAIVLSSGILLEKEFGRMIDEHEVVVRFNMAPTRGYEQYVGTRTTYMWAFKTSYDKFKREMNTPEYKGTILVISPFKWDIEALKNESGIPPSRCLIANERIIASRCKHEWQTEKDAAVYPNRRCTSGVNAVIHFMEVCATVNVFGLDAHASCDYPYHYYDDIPGALCVTDAKNNKNHNFTREHETMSFYSRILPRLNIVDYN